MAVIGIFDSGSGGLSVLKELRQLIPQARYIYYSDNANCPYGDKAPEFILQRGRFITGLLLDKGADIIVVACNTATAAAISALREEFPVPFVGMEPAVKPAALQTRTGVIGVLATAGTLKGSLYLDTKSKYEDDVQIIEHVGRGYVELVEGCELSGAHASAVVRASLQPLLDAGADRIVLGCTHYPFLLPLMEAAAPQGVQFINPAPAVARQTLHVLQSSGLLPPDTSETSSSPADSSSLSSLLSANCAVELISSGDPAPLEHLYHNVICA